LIVKKSVVISLLSLLLLIHVPGAMAAPPENELHQYLAKIGWTKQDLMDYLTYYEIPLNEINSVADLKDILGTPVNEENYQELLNKYKLTDKQLKTLLSHFGDSLSEYKFIDDLDTSVSFYIQHDDFMAEIENDLNELGITDQEVERFFDYIGQVEEKNKNQLDQLKLLDARIEQYLNKTTSSELNKEQVAELAEIFSKATDLLEIKVNFKMNNQDITLQDLIEKEDIPGNLYTSVYSNTGNLLIDFNLTSDFFQSVTNGLDEILHLGDLSNEFVDLTHEGKYKSVYK
jgi:processed acidic surface protein